MIIIEGGIKLCKNNTRERGKLLKRAILKGERGEK